jgi:nucleoside-diphosphate-sugar epimerase
VGSDNEYTIKQVADLILKKLSISEDIVLYNDPPGSVKRRCPEINKIKKLGYEPRIDLSEGIDKILEIDYGIKN